MSSAINITTLSGVRLDLFPDATLEDNMAGISLLNLSTRYQAYSEDYEMPKTPVNDAELGYASQSTRSNIPEVDVYVTTGQLQRKGVLRAVSFSDRYKCSISYSDISTLDLLKTTALSSIYDFVYNGQAEIPFVTEFAGDGLDGWYALSFGVNANNALDNKVPDILNQTCNNIGIKLSALFTKIETELSVVFAGDLITDAVFLASVLQLPGAWLDVVDTGGGALNITMEGNESEIMLSDILKEICLLFRCTISIENTTITINKFAMPTTSINIEGWQSEKQISPQFGAVNRINYTLSEQYTNLNEFGDFFDSNGEDNRVLVQMKSYLPYSMIIRIVGNAYDAGVSGTPIEYLRYFYLKDDKKIGSTISIGTRIQTNNGPVKFINIIENIPRYLFQAIDITDTYSDIFAGMMTAPIILQAEKYITTVEASAIQTNRLITSVQLGGTYWVDEMRYNRTTGKAIVKLIKTI